MKAWMLDQPGQPLALRDVPQPEPRRGALLVRVEAVPLLSYTRQYVQGKLPYGYPQGPFSPGTNGIGRVLAVGEGVYGYRVGQRVALSPYWIADEALREPAQALLGLTAISPDSGPMLGDYPHGTLREAVEFPASTVFPLDGLDHVLSAQLAALGKLVVPFGGLPRAGAFGSAAVLDALALGAGRVVALGRRAAALAPLAKLGGGRVVTVALSGEMARDVEAIRAAANGGADLAFDMVGHATDPGATLAALRSLRRNGRMVLMGSMEVDLPIKYGEMLINNWELMGHFMYSGADYRALIALVQSGQLPLDAIEVQRHPFDALETAIDAAEKAEGLTCVTVCTSQGA
ncbi:zinc-binding dehydrogenase [Paraburkholderia sp. BR14262]|uniref:zinc-binding dehydrogenase n=1 Tax=Paraburkholderia sp. BR14262 TaxID=3236999 RepID=UPI0034CF613E